MVVKCLLGILGTTSFYLYQYIHNWPLLKQSGILGSFRFADLVAIQEISRCVRTLGMQVYAISESCSGYQYSIGILYLFDFLSLSRLNPNLIAAIIEIPVLSLFVGILVMAFRKNWRVGIFATLGALAPGNWLLLERGNLDLLMVALLAIAAVTFSRRYEAMGFFTLIISIFTKFYTAPLLLIYILFGKRQLKKIYLPVSILSILISIYQIKHVAKFPSTWYVSFGSGSIGHWINLFIEYQLMSDFRLQEKIGLLVGVLILAISTYFHFALMSRHRIETYDFSNTHQNLVLFFGLTFIACYVVGMNYDYRMIFPIIAAIILVTEEGEIPCQSYFVSISVGSFFLSSYFYGQSGMSVIYQQLAGDVFIGLFTSYLITFFILRYKVLVVEILKYAKHKS